MPYWELAALLRRMNTDFGRGTVYGMALNTSTIQKYELQSLENIAFQLNGGKSA